eukprot:jgi/Bigna1/141996/aug1.66_g16704
MEHISTYAVLLTILTLFQLVNFFSSGALHDVDLKPRDFPIGFVGLLVSPLVEESFGMFVFNMIPFTIQILYILARGGTHLAMVLTFLGSGVGGMLTWLLARQDSHFCGVGPLIATYGLYLTVSGFFSEKNREMILGSGCFVAYVFLACLLSENARMICWEGITFCGLIGGGFAYYARNANQDSSDVMWKKVPDDILCDDDEDALEDPPEVVEDEL